MSKEEVQKEASGFRAGYVAVFGRPNVGKSTLVNTFIGSKISIVSEQPQTTRDRILCIYDDDEAQIVFLDTPGMHKPRDQMNDYMVRQARQSLQDADLSLVMVEAQDAFGPGDRYLATWLKESNAPAILTVNKIDLVSPIQIKQLQPSIPEPNFWLDQYYISALEGLGVSELLSVIKSRMPVGTRFFPEGVLTDRTERYLVGELVRESIFQLTREEVPHSSAVVIEEFKEREDAKSLISATVYVETESQKGIIVGKDGQMIKRIGSSARLEMERLTGRGVFLDLRVKVRKKWRKNPRDLREFGYQ